MPHTIEWYLPKRIVFMYVEGNFTLENFSDVSNGLIELFDEGEAPIYLLVDDSQVEKIPIKLRHIQTQFEFMRHPSLGWIVSIGDANPLLNYIIPMVTKIIGIKFVRYKTMEEALNFIKKQDQTIEWQDTK